MAADTATSDYGTVYYRSKDSIKNLKIRVHLQRITSSSIVPQAFFEQKVSSQTGETEMREVRRQEDMMSSNEDEFYIVGWQDKLFSQREFEMYKDENNCTTVIDKKYNKEIGAMNARPTKRIFSYVNHDKFANQKESFQRMTTSPSEKPTKLAEMVANVRRRRAAASSKLIESKGFAPKVNIVDMKPTTESIRRNHVIATPEQTMFIMADLSSHDKVPLEEDEYVLCMIKVDANGVITMKPNFNHNKKPYRIETDNLGKEVFQYTLENVSSQMSNLAKKREEKMYKELYGRHSQYLSGLVGTEFDLPSPGILRLALQAEIHSAWSFEYDDLFVRYFINVPSKAKGWTVDPESQISGVTQTCVTKVDEWENVAFFSYPFEAEMSYKKQSTADDEDDKIIHSWPAIYFEVCSLDSWYRFRPEGYGAISIPNTPGEHFVELNCWRPVGASVVSNLRRFFIGGAPELEDLSYTHIPSNFKGSRLSRYGFKTESTGKLKVRLNIILQSQSYCFSSTKRKDNKRETLTANIGSTVDFSQIKTVVDSFAKAHERMKLARENVLRNLQDLSLDDTTTLGVTGHSDLQ